MRKIIVPLILLTSIAGAPVLAQGVPQTISAVDIKTIGTGFRSSKVVGSTVVNDKGETVGKIDDLLIPATGQAIYAVLSVGGFLGVDTKLVAIRYDQLQADPGKGEYVLINATKDTLKTMPDYVYAK